MSSETRCPCGPISLTKRHRQTFRPRKTTRTVVGWLMCTVPSFVLLSNWIHIKGQCHIKSQISFRLQVFSFQVSVFLCTSCRVFLQQTMGQNIYDCVPAYRQTMMQCKALADISNRGCVPHVSHNARQQSFYFTQQELDFVLFGYSSTNQYSGSPAHALSGLKIGEISHGNFTIITTYFPVKWSSVQQRKNFERLYFLPM